MPGPKCASTTGSLLEEIVNRYDLDGLELDFMRFPYHFRIGHELEGGEILTAWLLEVRGLTDAAAKRLGHPVQLAVRVPAEPETARQMGLDAVRWAREGLVDLVTVTPFWETSDFNMPVRLWRRLLDGTGVSLAGGLEILVRPYRSLARRVPDAGQPRRVRRWRCSTAAPITSTCSTSSTTCPASAPACGLRPTPSRSSEPCRRSNPWIRCRGVTC